MKCINIFGKAGKEGCRSSARSRGGLALQLHAGTIDLQHDKGQPFDLKSDGLVVLELHVQTQHLVVEDLGLLQVLYEQDDGSLETHRSPAAVARGSAHADCATVPAQPLGSDRV